MTKIAQILSVLSVSIMTAASAATESPIEVTFDQVKPHRENFAEKTVQLDGRIKDLKVIKEAGNRFATFFLVDPSNPETSVSVRVNLSKKKTIINTFNCTEGEF